MLDKAQKENNEERDRINTIVSQIIDTNDFTIDNQLKLAAQLLAEFADNLDKVGTADEFQLSMFATVGALANTMFMLAEERKKAVDSGMEEFTSGH